MRICFCFAFSLLAPQETQSSQPIHKLKLCPPDHFQRLKTTKADEVFCFGIGRNTIYPLKQDTGDILGILVHVKIIGCYLIMLSNK